MSRAQFQYHPVFGYHFIPGLRARVSHEGGGYLVRANASGFRSDREFVPTKAPGTYRVLLFGDSYTAGDGVSNGARYGDLLEALLPNVEVYNFGLPGSGTDQQWLIHREMARGIDADLVIAAVLVENVRRNAARYRLYDTGDGEQLFAKPYFTLDAPGGLTLHNVPVPKDPIPPHELLAEDEQFVDRGGGLVWLRKLVDGLGLKSVVQSLVGQNPLPAYDRADSPEWLLTRAILSAWLAPLDVPVVLMPVPLYHYIEEIADPGAYRARFTELAASLPNATLHDPLVDFLAVPKVQRRSFRFEHDVHPTPLAHKLMAESLARVIAPMASRASSAAGQASSRTPSE
ncbi:MAG: SGNH/GDSL hydrolase family protein [Gemmatimonadota bacterium]|nr:SGNH/GDSL hydrolase family protein [Gemmatimonadota bacterium]